MNKGLSDVSRCTFALRKSSKFYEDLASNTAQRMLANVEKLAPDISSRAAEIEALRQIPPDLIEALRVIGVFRCSFLGLVAEWNWISRRHSKLSARFPVSTVRSGGMR